MKACFVVTHSTAIHKSTYPLVVLKETPFRSETERNHVEDFFRRPVVDIFSYFTEKE